MAETKIATAPDEASQGLVYQDGPEDMARMARYEDYLRLQQRADGMSNAEYLAELDKIMEQGDDFDKGETQYGADVPRDEKDELDKAEQLRANLDDDKPGTVRDMDGNAYLLHADDDTGRDVNAIPEQVQVFDADGTSMEQDRGTDTGTADGPTGRSHVGTRGGEPEDGIQPEDPAMAERPEIASESFLGADPIIHDGLDDDDLDKIPETSAQPVDIKSGPVLGADGHVQANIPAAPGDMSTETPSAPVAPAVPGPDGEIAQTPVSEMDSPEQSVPGPVAGMEPAAAQVRAEDAVLAQDAANAPAEPVPAGPGTYHVPGHVVVHEELFETADFLDEMSVATGLASSVQTAEYIPPMDVSVPSQPGAGSQQQVVPERSEKMQALMAKAERDKQRDMERAGPTGPSV